MAEKIYDAETRAMMNEYLREWRKKNPKKTREYRARYWKRVDEKKRLGEQAFSITAQRIRKRLDYLGITANTLAEITGLSTGLLKRYMDAPKEKPIDIGGKNLCTLANALQTSVDYLLGRTDLPDIVGEKTENTPVKNGYWQVEYRSKNDKNYAIMICSECGRVAVFQTRLPYCPYCGAKMDAELRAEV